MSNYISIDRVKDYRSESGHESVTPLVEMWRDDHLVCIVKCLRMDRDDAVEAIQFLTPILEADRVSLLVDANIAPSAINPETGRAWQQGEVGESPDARDAMVAISASEDEIEQVLLPYENVGGVIIFDDATFNMAPASMQGYIPDQLRKAFQNKNEVVQQIKADLEPMRLMLGLDEQEAQVRTDSVAVQFLMQQGIYMVAFGAYPDGDPRNDILQESLENASRNGGGFKVEDTRGGI